jgi:hypothetical protein
MQERQQQREHAARKLRGRQVSREGRLTYRASGALWLQRLLPIGQCHWVMLTVGAVMTMAECGNRGAPGQD